MIFDYLQTIALKHSHHQSEHDHDGHVREDHEQRGQHVDPSEDQDKGNGTQYTDGQSGQVRIH